MRGCLESYPNALKSVQICENLCPKFQIAKMQGPSSLSIVFVAIAVIFIGVALRDYLKNN